MSLQNVELDYPMEIVFTCKFTDTRIDEFA